MRRRVLLSICTTGLLGLALPYAQADTIQFNTDTGVMLINGSPSSTFFGVLTPITFGALNISYIMAPTT